MLEQSLLKMLGKWRAVDSLLVVVVVDEIVTIREI